MGELQFRYLTLDNFDLISVLAGFFILWNNKLHGLFYARAILVEQLRYYLPYGWLE